MSSRARNASPAAGPKRSARAAYRTGRETRETIIRAAEEVLVEHGHSDFTLKRVADAVGISVGNVSYHFSTKDTLLEELIESTLRNYLKLFTDMLGEPSGSVSKMLGDVLEWTLTDATTERYSQLFRELWTMSLHSPIVAKAVHRFYYESIEIVVEILSKSPHSPPKTELRLIVSLICAITEGSAVLFGIRSDLASRRDGVGRLARRAIERLLLSD